MLTNRNYVVKGKNSNSPKSPKFQKYSRYGKICMMHTEFHVEQTLSTVFVGRHRDFLYDAHEKLYKRYGCTAKPMEEATNARLASVSTVEWLIFLRTKRKERRPGKI